MDIRNLKKIIEIFENAALSELEIRQGEESVRICRQTSHGVTAVPSFHSTIAVTPEQATQPHVQVNKPAEPQPHSHGHDIPSGHIVKSPMVGTLYTSPSPGAKAFVEIGQMVRAGDTLCIIEAMKMFNQIEADISGILKARLVENGQPIEYDQPLFVIEPQN